MRKANLEKIADNILASAGQQDTLAIDVVAIARHNGFRVSEVMNANIGSRSYKAVTGQGEINICLSYNTSIEAKRYTIAYELAHHVLHQKEGFALRKSLSKRESLRLMKDVEYLARCILLPRNAFLSAYRKLRQIETKAETIFGLHRIFRVSSYTIKSRLRDFRWRV